MILTSTVHLPGLSTAKYHKNSFEPTSSEFFVKFSLFADPVNPARADNVFNKCVRC